MGPRQAHLVSRAVLDPSRVRRGPRRSARGGAQRSAGGRSPVQQRGGRRDRGRARRALSWMAGSTPRGSSSVAPGRGDHGRDARAAKGPEDRTAGVADGPKPAVARLRAHQDLEGPFARAQFTVVRVCAAGHEGVGEGASKRVAERAAAAGLLLDAIGMTRCGFVAIMGAPNAGKSTLLNRLTGAKLSIVSPKAQTTRFRVLGILMRGHSQVLLVDTPGIFKPRRKLDRAMVARGLDRRRGRGPQPAAGRCRGRPARKRARDRPRAGASGSGGVGWC